MSTAINARMTELLTRRVPFVHVTVVRAEKPTSVRPGDDAIVLADGSIEGFVGGVCAEGSVRTAALAALADGETLLLRVLPDSDEPFPDSPGAQVVTNPCLSGGALEMFLEPLLPAPVLAVVGDTPIAHAVRVMAGSLGFEVGPAGSGSDSDAGSGSGPDSGSGLEDAVAVIISSLGRGEHQPIRAALDAGVGFIGLVASQRRGRAVLSELRLTDAERSRIRTPVGLWIGAKTAEEIALSIMAEVVKAIRTEGLTAPQRSAQSAAAPTSSTSTGITSPAAEPTGSSTGAEPADSSPIDSTDSGTTVATAVDPICGMTVTIGPDTPQLHRDGVDHWFCCAGCRERFAAGAA
jgi:xanthine dehydrogenase accessory factor